MLLALRWQVIQERKVSPALAVYEASEVDGTISIRPGIPLSSEINQLEPSSRRGTRRTGAVCHYRPSSDNSK
jgi:hypothetical protein